MPTKIFRWHYNEKVRRGFQAAALIIYNPFFISFKYCPVPGLNCYACPIALGACPLGSLQHFMVLRKIPFFLVGFFLLIGGTLGRMVCGWACPVGWLQEVIFKVPAKKITLKASMGGYLSKLKYVLLLVLVLFVPFVTGEPWFSKVCFVGTLQGGIPLAFTEAGIRALVGTLFYIKLGITILLLILFVFIKRPFCRFLCPLGAIYSLFNGFSYLQLRVEHGCNQCNECQALCPVDIQVYRAPNSPECIRCLRCTACEHVTLGTKQKESYGTKRIRI